jgi:hypothetical protein
VILVKQGSKVKFGKARTGIFKTRYEPDVGSLKIRAAQAKELTKDALKSSEQVILADDLDSGDAKDNEPEKPGDELALKALTKFGMKNNGARQSCCFENLLDPNGVFDHTVDHVLTKPGLTTVKAFVTGHDASERTPSGLWPSDHGGVVSRLRLR